MSRISSWTTRIPLILQHLATDAKPVYTRPEVAALFNIGRSRAADLMKIAGAEVRNGAEATVSRGNLRYYIERCPEAKAYLIEQERKEKLARQLVQTAEDLRLRQIEIPAQRSDRWARWKDLPNVELAPGRLTITFGDAGELLRSLLKISQAMANDFEAFVEICAPTERPAPEDRSAEFPDWRENGVLG